MYIKLIRQANLDAFGGQAITTTSAYASATKRLVGKCAMFRKTPMIPPRGPFPLSDTVGMSTAVNMLFHSITAKSRLAGEMHIQYNSMRKIRLTYMRSWASLPQGVGASTAPAAGFGQLTGASCPTQQEWYSLFARGAEIRMGYATQANLPLSSETIARTLKVIRREAEGEDPRIAREYLKVGAAIAVAVCASLRGPEVFQRDLAGLKANISRVRDGTMPHDPPKGRYGSIQSALCPYCAHRAIQGRNGNKTTHAGASEQYQVRHPITLVDRGAHQDQRGRGLHTWTRFWR
jgi:hypothetical protein